MPALQAQSLLPEMLERTRVAFASGLLEGEGLDARRPLEFGVSGVVGQMRTTSMPTGRVVADVWGLGENHGVGFQTQLQWKF